MDTFLQVCIIVFSLSYKLLLAQKIRSGWLIAMLTAGISCAYLLAFKHMPILACLEAAFFILNGYGFYKAQRERQSLGTLDLVTILFAGIVIGYLIERQIATNTVWYEVVSSVAFLSGVIALAQKPLTAKMSGWLLYATGSLFYAVAVYKQHSYGIVCVNVLSIFICLYGAYKNVYLAKTTKAYH